jgi:hypothetical protein
VSINFPFSDFATDSWANLMLVARSIPDDAPYTMVRIFSNLLIIFV